ncbi:hypothetical protein [Blastococcus sp. TF02-8]|uniref:hypothetical protein n=1 Tax=Blastococcus sp. TF02-8 TaxID=2250574 RepID=UPI0011BFA0B7|nr:hypothetical protein [Blastococcus sp. TF02-8]
MNAPGLPLHAPVPAAGRPDDGLALVLDLMAHEAPAPAGPGWTERAQDWAQRAAAWGEGPRGAWRAW